MLYVVFIGFVGNSCLFLVGKMFDYLILLKGICLVEYVIGWWSDV